MHDERVVLPLSKMSEEFQEAVIQALPDVVASSGRRLDKTTVRDLALKRQLENMQVTMFYACRVCKLAIPAVSGSTSARTARGGAGSARFVVRTETGTACTPPCMS